MKAWHTTTVAVVALSVLVQLPVHAVQAPAIWNCAAAANKSGRVGLGSGVASGSGNDWTTDAEIHVRESVLPPSSVSWSIPSGTLAVVVSDDLFPRSFLGSDSRPRLQPSVAKHSISTGVTEVILEPECVAHLDAPQTPSDETELQQPAVATQCFHRCVATALCLGPCEPACRRICGICE